MDLRIQDSGADVNWALVRDALKAASMGYYEPERHQSAFGNSFAVVFVFLGERMIGFGRAISDGACQAAIYDMVVIPEFQRKGVGTIIMNRLLEKTAGCNLILYANPGKEGFYSTLGFRLLKTGMAKYLNPQKMAEKGILA